MDDPFEDVPYDEIGKFYCVICDDVRDGTVITRQDFKYGASLFQSTCEFCGGKIARFGKCPETFG